MTGTCEVCLRVVPVRVVRVAGSTTAPVCKPCRRGARRRPNPRDPTTPAQWQEAADAAAGALALDSMRQYGLVTGGPGVDIDRCSEILRRAAARGVRPATDAADRFLTALVLEQRAEAP